MSVIDIENNTKITDIEVGERPIAIRINYDSGKIYVANSYNDTVSVIDENNTKIKDIEVKETCCYNVLMLIQVKYMLLILMITQSL